MYPAESPTVRRRDHSAGSPVAPRRADRLHNWLKAQTTEDLIDGARAMNPTADLRLDMLAELVVRGVQNDLTADAAT